MRLSNSLKIVIAAVSLPMISVILMGDCNACNDADGSMCFTVDPLDCPNLVYSKFCVNQYSCETSPRGPYSEVTKTTCGTARNGNGTPYIAGDEINFGFWKKNDRHEKSYAELFEMVHGYWPDPYEQAHITDEQARYWFDSIYADHNLFGTDPPENVTTYTVTTAADTICYPHAPAGDCWWDRHDGLVFDGSVDFGDGVKCKLEPVYYSQQGDWCESHTFVLRVKRPCQACPN